MHNTPLKEHESESVPGGTAMFDSVFGKKAQEERDKKLKEYFQQKRERARREKAQKRKKARLARERAETDAELSRMMNRQSEEPNNGFGLKRGNSPLLKQPIKTKQTLPQDQHIGLSGKPSAFSHGSYANGSGPEGAAPPGLSSSRLRKF